MSQQEPDKIYNEVVYRSATLDDCTQLTLIADMASRRLASYFWGQSAGAGQSAFVFGRDVIRNNETHLAHFTNWRVAERGGIFIGAFNGHILPPAEQQPRPDSPVAQPPYELKQIAAGSWYLPALAIMPEFQGLGYAPPLLKEAERCANYAGATELTLLVGSFNHKALRLYTKCGFIARDRRSFVPFPGSDSEGEWILMSKALASTQ